MLNKKQEKYLFIGTSVFVSLIFLIAVFIWPNFYMQYRVVFHPTPITDVTADEREIIKNNIDFELPDTAVIQKISKSAAAMESAFFMTFAMPVENKEEFVDSISNLYRLNALSTQQEHVIDVNGQEYTPVQCYEHISQNFTAILEYGDIDNWTYFKLIYTDGPQALDDIFYERIRIMPKWLDFY